MNLLRHTKFKKYLALSVFSPFAFSFALAAIGIASLISAQEARAEIDYAKLEESLKTTGLVGEIHGSVNPLGLYVFTYRTPGNFFEHAEFPMITADATVKTQLQELQRHDKVRLFGAYAGIDAPQRHIKVTKLEKTYDYVPPVEIPIYTYPPEVRDEIRNGKTMVARIHAIAEQGRVMVIEYKGYVLPIPIFESKDLDITLGLYRNDKIRLHYTVQKKPGKPMHIQPDKSMPVAIEVLQRIKDEHGKQVERTGSLVLFPKSPQVSFDIYALQMFDTDGVPTEYTLLNFENMDLFAAIRQKAADAWAKSPTTGIAGRNKIVNPKIQVNARGTYNLITFDQANPQILIDKIEDIEFKILE